jgi:hypothetical protein
MTIRIAGTPVAVNDQLFSRRAAAWGRVTQVTDNVAVLSITKSGSTRVYTVTEGGNIAGGRDVYWTEPVALDLPKAQAGKLVKIQAVVDALIEVL